jgi:hypothetical protein
MIACSNSIPLHKKMKRNALLPLVLLIATTLCCSVNAFAPTLVGTTQSTPVSRRGDDMTLSAIRPRRAVFGWIKRAVLATAGVATLSGNKSLNAPAFAEDETATTTGRIVEFTVNNLEGNEGQSGIVRIQLRPEWAPKGVARFEVRLHILHCTVY